MYEDKQSFFRKAWEVLFPLLLYDITYHAAYIILVFLQSALQKSPGGGYGQWVTAHAETVSGAAGGLCMLLGICPLLPVLREELTGRVEFMDSSFAGREGEGKAVSETSVTKDALVTVILAVSSSLALNILMTLTGFAESSQTYREVAGRQYGVAFGVGIILYGLVSPLAEEVVFRGIIYNRLRRFYGPAAAVVLSGILFGVFHGNLVQGVYGACMGVLIAYVYERRKSFFYPVLFHASANIAVYVTACEQTVQEALFTPFWGVALLAVSAGCVFYSREQRAK